MSLPIRDWLPENAYTSPALAEAVITAVGQWAERWFGARMPVLQIRPRPGSEGKLTSGKRWHCLAPGIWLEWCQQTQLDHARLALDRAQHDRNPGEQDKQLLLLFASRMERDLASALVELLGEKPSPGLLDGGSTPPARGLLAAWNNDHGNASLQLLIAHDALITLRRQQCPRQTQPARTAVKLAEVVGTETVTVEAIVGAVRISARDLKEIAVGDIVVVDRGKADLIELRRTGSERTLANAQLRQDGGKLTLETRMN